MGKYDIRERLCRLDIDIEMLEKINPQILKQHEKNRLNFLIFLYAEIKKSKRFGYKINYSSLLESYSTYKATHLSKRWMYVLVNELLNPDITYYDFIFSKKIGGQCHVIDTQVKIDIINSVAETINKIKNNGVDHDTMTERDIALIYKDRKVTYTHLYEFGSYSDLISYDGFVKLLRSQGIKSDSSRRSRAGKISKTEKERKKLMKMMKRNIKTKEISEEPDHEKPSLEWDSQSRQNLLDIAKITKKATQIIPNSTAKVLNFGEIVELDGCLHRWFGTNQSTLYAAVDRATGVILSYHLEKEETTEGYKELIVDLFLNHGAPKEIRTDCRTTFWVSKNDDTANTPLVNCLKRFDCKLGCSSDPRYKPTVERTFGSLQTRIVQEAAIKNIQTEEEFMPFLAAKIAEYNKACLAKHPNKKDLLRTVTKDELCACFVQSFTRVVTPGLTVSINNEHYEVLDDYGKTRMKYKNKLTIYESYLHQGVYWIKQGSQKVLLTKLNGPYNQSRAFQINEWYRIRNKIIKLENQYTKNLCSKDEYETQMNIYKKIMDDLETQLGLNHPIEI